MAHGIWINDSERDLLAERGVTVSQNPISNAMLGSGRRRLRDDLDAGLKIALGTDCSNTGGRHDLFEVMRHMLVSGRDPGSDFETWLTPDEVLSAATTYGAGSLNSGKSPGFVKAGAAADVVDVATRDLPFTRGATFKSGLHSKQPSTALSKSPNEEPKPFIWKADLDDITAAVRRGHHVLESID
ncbi:Hypothetical protein NGAL_HAMBI2566_61950 [Neorhizobium galegae bv. orientalis]|nr:amidohydrolase family protein [Neorhizobium galegae]CDZ64755.1 Hypothetical protein NGAL_HAMBI2566_61950 [Neorhizobium galegae bv. orientalis]